MARFLRKGHPTYFLFSAVLGIAYRRGREQGARDST